MKNRRIKKKWSIHEHVYHLYESQKMMMERFKVFKRAINPEFLPYLLGSTSTPTDHLITMDMAASMKGFAKDRMHRINYVKTFTKEDWGNQGSHPEYIVYSQNIFKTYHAT